MIYKCVKSSSEHDWPLGQLIWTDGKTWTAIKPLDYAKNSPRYDGDWFSVGLKKYFRLNKNINEFI